MKQEDTEGGENLAPAKSQRAFEQICEQIRQEIQNGNLSAGDKLPAERDLAEQFQVSRATVREAFRTLEIGGVLAFHKGVKGGAFIQMGNARPITQTMQDLLSLGGVSLKDFTEARVCLQKEIIRLACERGTDEDFAALEDNIARTIETNAPERLSERTNLTIEFYALLAKATKNSVMSVLMSAITEPLGFYINRIGHDRDWDVAASRSKFVKHLKARDVDAAIDEMVTHMQRLHEFMLKKSEESRE